MMISGLLLRRLRYSWELPGKGDRLWPKISEKTARVGWLASWRYCFCASCRERAVWPLLPFVLPTYDNMIASEGAVRVISTVI